MTLTCCSTFSGSLLVFQASWYSFSSLQASRRLKTHSSDAEVLCSSEVYCSSPIKPGYLGKEHCLNMLPPEADWFGGGSSPLLILMKKNFIEFLTIGWSKSTHRHWKDLHCTNHWSLTLLDSHPWFAFQGQAESNRSSISVSVWGLLLLSKRPQTHSWPWLCYIDVSLSYLWTKDP